MDRSLRSRSNNNNSSDDDDNDDDDDDDDDIEKGRWVHEGKRKGNLVWQNGMGDLGEMQKYGGRIRFLDRGVGNMNTALRLY